MGKIVDLPVLVINFKTYEEGRGAKGLQLAKLSESIAKEYSVDIVVVPQLVDMQSIASQVDIPVFSQHMDTKSPGSATGHIEVSALKEGGIQGTLLNHSERRLEISILEESVDLAGSHGLKSIVCAGTIALSRAVSSFNPWAVAMEPPELIGGDVSVTTRPQAVKDAVAAVISVNPTIIPLTGAGVKTADHLGTAIDLGSKGVLLASGIVKATEPKSVLEEMAKIMSKY
ncbi:MAG: triose-phosphate isomerase [Candidatus Kariarchaeaceae archaeon]|jgi:triosephosphate isomerase